MAEVRQVGPPSFVLLLLFSGLAIWLTSLVDRHVLPKAEFVEAPWGFWVFLFFSLLMMGLTLLLGHGYNMLAAARGLAPLKQENVMQMLLLQSLVNLIMVGGILAMACNAGPDGRRALGLVSRPVRRTVVAVLQMLVLFIPVYFLSLLLGLFVFLLVGREPSAQAVVEQAMSVRGEPVFLLFAFFAVVLAPLAEEMLYRGVLYPALRRRLPVLWAAGICGFIFSLVHGEPMALVPLFALGTFLALLFERTGSLLAPICAHAMFNAAQLAYMVLGSPA